MRSTHLIILFGLFTVVLNTATAETIDARVARLERVVESRALVEMLSRIDSLQQEVAQLRGEIEEQTHSVNQLKERQRELYLDIDRRLSRMEREGGSVASTSQATTPQQTAIVTGSGAVSSAPATTGKSPSTEDIQKEREAYQNAFNLLRELRYEQATNAFTSFLNTYPDGRYAHIARYWLGEANYAQRKFKPAIADYRKLIANHPDSPKLAEAMLKIGYSYNELGNRKEAVKILNTLTARYPGTTEAGQAEVLLKKLKK